MIAPLGHPIYTRDKTSPRGFKWIWFIRLFQILVTLGVLIATGVSAASFGNISCSVPGKLAWNLACAAIALTALAYFFLSTGPTTAFRILPWWIFIQLGLDSLLFIFWLAAAATSRLNCNDLCNACPGASDVYFDDLSCTCLSDYYWWYKKRSMSPAPKSGLLETRRTRNSTPTGKGAARISLDAIMVVLFFITLVSTILYIFQNRNRSNTTAPTTGPAPHPEAGVQQVQAEPKQDIPYNQNNTNPQMQQGGYPPVSPQQNYAPQGQYPPQQQQYPQQEYPPQGQQQPQQPLAYYGGPEVGQQPVQQSREVGHQQPQRTENYPTPTPEMQAERRE